MSDYLRELVKTCLRNRLELPDIDAAIYINDCVKAELDKISSHILNTDTQGIKDYAVVHNVTEKVLSV